MYLKIAGLPKVLKGDLSTLKCYNRSLRNMGDFTTVNNPLGLKKILRDDVGKHWVLC